MNLASFLRAAAPWVLATVPFSAQAQFSFNDLTGVFSSSNLVGISPDGTTLLGQSPEASGFGQPLYYRSGQITYLPLLTYGNGIARSMSSDGTIVGGVLRGHEEGTDDAGVWRNGQLSLIEHEPGGLTTDATAISSDGHVIVGSSDSSTHLLLPTRWVDGHVESLAIFPDNFSRHWPVNMMALWLSALAAGFGRSFRCKTARDRAVPLIDPNKTSSSQALKRLGDGHPRSSGRRRVTLFNDELLWQDGIVMVLGYNPAPAPRPRPRSALMEA